MLVTSAMIILSLLSYYHCSHYYHSHCLLLLTCIIIFSGFVQTGLVALGATAHGAYVLEDHQLFSQASTRVASWLADAAWRYEKKSIRHKNIRKLNGIPQNADSEMSRPSPEPGFIGRLI